ncbi:MAG: ThuA domain-containing protein [Fuerstiella sp.]|nr:ThuA domain-containing protein [Fuerstiella sp.]
MFQISVFLLVLCTTFMQSCLANPKIKALIVDGQNNHSLWPKTTVMMKRYLETSGLFEVDVARTAFTANAAAELLAAYPIDGVNSTPRKTAVTDPDFKPNFAAYKVVISNMGHGAAPWPDATRAAFEAWMKTGGGLVVIHAADNSFPNWPAWNEMIGLGGWGGRSEKDGPYIYTNEKGDLIRDTSTGRGGHHGVQHEYSVVIRDSSHPITQGLPAEWLHAKDELYDRLRGPALNMRLLATSYSDPDTNGSGRHEPIMFTVGFGKGRVFHTPMGHADYSQECVGFITVLLRGTEWAATGEVTLAVPDDFPTADASSSRQFSQ